MTGVEIILLLAGCVFMVGSFFITEKLSPSELNKIAELSEDEIKKIIDRSLSDAGSRIQQEIEDRLDASSDMVERAMDRETNVKIMAISDYSDTVIENMNKTHNEIVFLYNMLNDKHAELTSMAGDLQRLAADVRSMQETMKKPAVPVRTVKPDPMKRPGAAVPRTAVEAQRAVKSAAPVKDNHNGEILVLHKQGLNDVEIARKLGLGIGEVKLVIGLYKGETNS